MNHNHSVEAELAARLERLEQGAIRDEGQHSVNTEIVDLLRLAHQIRSLPPIEPDPAWLQASKGRLMARFSARQAERGR
jgi:hypothetical protein